MPSLVDILGIIVILGIVFGASAFPRLGEAIGRAVARRKGLLPSPSTEQRSEREGSAKDEDA